MNGLPANECDVCSRPGACCTNFRLNTSFWDHLDINAQWLERALDNEPYNGPMQQFIPLAPNEGEKNILADDGIHTYSVWRFKCSALKNGRCSIYENRPNTCRTFKPKSDELCVMWQSSEVAV